MIFGNISCNRHFKIIASFETINRKLLSYYDIDNIIINTVILITLLIGEQYCVRHAAAGQNVSFKRFLLQLYISQ